MPRTLPWLVEAAQKRESKRATSLPKHPRASSPSGDLVDPDLNDVNEASPEPRRKEKRPARTPSTSPPPAPPDVEYMREGYQADDKYMMVEDEFLSTAKTFTQHIHHAEYVRLKKLAKSRGAGTLQAIQRPVDGRTAQRKALRLGIEVEAKAKQIQDGVRNVSGEDESSGMEEDYMQDPHLAGLMTREKSVSRDLSGILKARTDARVAAGSSPISQNLERKKDAFADNEESEPLASSSKAHKGLEMETSSTEGEDDLDVPAKTRRPTSAKAERRQMTPRGKGNSMEGKLEASETPKRKDTQRTSFWAGRMSAPTASAGDKSANSSTQSSAAAAYLAKRRADKESKEREEKRKVKRVDDIPTFLF